MSRNNDNPADSFKKALAEATKTMAHESDLNVTYSVDPSGVSGVTMRLPQVSRKMSYDEVLLARGTADALALNIRYHDAKTHKKYAPEGNMAQDIYEAIETARCEAMGARDMPGTANNIDAKISSEAKTLGYETSTDRADVPLSTAAGYLIRHLATGRDLPPAAQNAMNLWRDFIETKASQSLDNLQESLADLVSERWPPAVSTEKTHVPKNSDPFCFVELHILSCWGHAGTLLALVAGSFSSDPSDSDDEEDDGGGSFLTTSDASHMRQPS